MATGVQFFTCTACGRCCDRSPEVELSEAAPLADVFVFRLLLRHYWLPRRFADSGQPPDTAAAFYESKRLLTAFAARQRPCRRLTGGRSVDGIAFLTVSALALDTGGGTCSALAGERCGIYPRRPLACRSVPFHYARPEATAGPDLAGFVARPGYRCRTDADAEIAVAAGRIVPAWARAARAEALAVADRDRAWSAAIVRAMVAGPADDLPSLAAVEAQAGLGATTTWMRAAWRVGAELGLVADADALLCQQLALARQILAEGRCDPAARATLLEMVAAYQQARPAPPNRPGPDRPGMV